MSRRCESFLINDLLVPQILITERDYLLVFKPSGMHSAPLKNSPGVTMFDWCGEKFPEFAKLIGRKKGEGGLLHRLDYETHGLMIIARTEAGMENLLNQQKEGKIIKEYEAFTKKAAAGMPGFPPQYFDNSAQRFTIKSAFRPYGTGGKAVRPMLQGKKEYVTEIIERKEKSNGVISFTVKITSGFRHQIRCHLAWTGYPIINDKLYGGATFGNGMLGLSASGISFLDPSTGEKRIYSINLHEETALYYSSSDFSG